MIIEAVQPFKIQTKTLGKISLKVGERVTWPDRAVEMLLEKIPEKIRIIDPPLCKSGEHVRYKTPVKIESPQKYEWIHRAGTVQGFDARFQLVEILPDDPRQQIIQIAKCYVSLAPMEEPNHDGTI